MDHNMERTSQMLALIYAIIEVADAELEDFLRRLLYQRILYGLPACLCLPDPDPLSAVILHFPPLSTITNRYPLFNNYSPKARWILVNKNRDEVDVFIHRYSSNLRWIIVLV